MLTKYLQVVVAFSSYMMLVHGENCLCGTVPFQFCEGTYYLEYEYSTNLTTENSVFVPADHFRSQIRNISSIQKACSHKMLELEVKRSIDRSPNTIVAIYSITVNVQEIYRYNYTLLDRTLILAILQCLRQLETLNTDLDLQFLHFNTSGYLLTASLIRSREDIVDCNIVSLQKYCIKGSNKTKNKTCEISPGWHCNVNQTKPVRCPMNTYQQDSGMCSCNACPQGSTTLNKTGSDSLSHCLSDCLPGQYLDDKLKHCVPCPENTYQEEPAKLSCNPCPSETTTSKKTGSTDRSNCSKASPTSLSKDGVDVLAIVLPIVAVIVVLFILAILVKLTMQRRKMKELNRSLRENFTEIFENPYYQEIDDEERGSEHCAALGPLEHEVLARNLEVPRDQLKLTGVRLGRGNFGEVHQALLKKDNEPEMLCAAKMARGGSRVSIADMLDELDVHLKIKMNPNVVNLLGVCSSSDGPFYLLVEYCDNGALNDFLIEHKETSHYVNFDGKQPLSLEWRLQRTLEICNGMKHLSSSKIVHRDLAARNVLLDKDMVAKVADFGMAKDIYIKSYYKQRQEDAFPLRWMAMEAIQNLSFNEKTDVWSFGVLVWEIFTEGNLPYYNIINDEKVAMYILTGKKLKQPPKCPKNVFRIVSKCWKNKAHNRPTFRELYEDLNLCIKNELAQKPDQPRPDQPRSVREGSLMRRFNEVSRSVSRRLSLRRPSTRSQISTTDGGHSSRRELPDPPNFDTLTTHSIDLESVNEDDEVLDNIGLPSDEENEDERVLNYEEERETSTEINNGNNTEDIESNDIPCSEIEADSKEGFQAKVPKELNREREDVNNCNEPIANMDVENKEIVC